MSVQNKPDYKIFASGAKTGETIPFPDILRGWGVTLDTTGGIPTMEFFNSSSMRLNEWLMYLTQRGVPEWDAVVDYPKSAMVMFGDVFYVSLKSTKNENPSTSQLSWRKFSDFLGVDGKLTKSENGADIPDKPKFIKNLGLGDAAKSNVTQTTGTSTTNVMSQKAVTDALGEKLNISDANFQPKGNYATNAALNNKLDANDVVQSTGQSTAKVMSQKAVTDSLFNKLDSSEVVQTTGQSTTQVMSQKAVTDSLSFSNEAWKDMKNERIKDTNYTNSTLKPIMISVQGDAAKVGVLVNGITVMASASEQNQGSFIVQPGATYSVSCRSILVWAELR